MVRRSGFSSCKALGSILFLGLAFTFLSSPGSVTAQQDSQSTSASAPTTAKPNLAGTWALNKDQSDDPRQKIHEAMGGSDTGTGGNGGGAWQGGSGGGRGHRGGPGGAGGMMAEFNQLTITQSDASVKITGASGRLLTQTSDSAKSNSPPPAPSGPNDGQQFSPPVAQWQGSQLVSTMEGRRGKTTRTYALSSDGKQLIVTTKIENERFNGPVTFRQVYDPASAGAPQPSQ
jgi:hypothetical protein